jgi:hypothetical protein
MPTKDKGRDKIPAFICMNVFSLFDVLNRPPPPVDGGEQEQPNHVNEVPIPSSRFKADVAFRCPMILKRAEIADS